MVYAIRLSDYNKDFSTLTAYLHVVEGEIWVGYDPDRSPFRRIKDSLIRDILEECLRKAFFKLPEDMQMILLREYFT